MLVFLIGFMGAGKTTLGSALAAQLGWPFIDLDREIERHSGCSVSEIFVRGGETEFRQMEQQVLYDTVIKSQNCIVACGGGTPCYEDNLAFMKENGFVIYLEVSPEILYERLLRTPASKRPLLTCTLPYIHNLLDQRRPFYEAAHWKC